MLLLQFPASRTNPERISTPMADVQRLYPEGYDHPYNLYFNAASEYARWADSIKRGGHLGLPWHAIHRMVGPLLPSWLVLIGGRAKGGKSTLMRAIFDAWVMEFKKKIMLVGTEQQAGLVRALWACLRLRVSQEAAINPKHPDYPRVMEDVTSTQGKDGLTDRAIIVAEPSITVETFKQWARVAYKEKCDAILFDHFHRLEDDGPSQNRSRNSAIREIKNIATTSNMVVMVAAQLKNGEGRLLGEFEVPGYDSWAETAGLRRECDVAIQCWRPFVSGVTRAQKAEAKDNPAKLAEIVQENTMAVRLDCHRYGNASAAKAARLTVNEGELTSWGAYHNGQISDPAEESE
jgi:hypothetical protein